MVYAVWKLDKNGKTVNTVGTCIHTVWHVHVIQCCFSGSSATTIRDVLGVMAIDFSVNYFYQLMQTNFPECAEALCENYWECFR